MPGALCWVGLPGPQPGASAAGRSGAALINLLIRGIRQVTVYLRRRRACLRIASTFAANTAGSMIGVPRHGDIDSRSVSLETMSSAPTSAARSRILMVIRQRPRYATDHVR
jgi:hypothetical protein